MADNSQDLQNQLKGVILAGDSWLSGSDKTAIANAAFGQNVSNVAIGGSTTKDVLNQLNNFLQNGGSFASGSTVVLDVGGNDLLSGVDKNTITNNLNQIVSQLGSKGVKVILSGAPNVGSVSDVTSSTQLAMDSLYNDVAKNNSNVTVVDAMSGLLNQKNLVDETGFHVNEQGQTAFINQLADAYNQGSNTVAPTPTKVVGGSVQTNPTVTPQDIVSKLQQQILAQGTTNQWSGQGKGSPEANAADMARILADTGITDISQFGKVAITQPVQEIGKTFNGKAVYTATDENGNPYQFYNQPSADGESNATPVRLPANAKLDTVYGVAGEDGYTPVAASQVRTVNGQLVADTGQTTFGNKDTGQAVANTYSERQTGNAFGGTFEGKGNTGYRVEFDASGKPVFYTTGASSSDAADWMPAIQLALAATGAGGLLGNALLGTGASQIASSALGNAILGGATTGIAGGDALKGALLGGAGGALSGYLKSMPIDASGMTSAQFNDAIENQLIKSMQNAGLSTSQISQFLENATPSDIASLTSNIPVTGASDNLVVEAAKTPITADALTNVLSQTPNIVVTGQTNNQVSPDVINAANTLLAGGTATTPTVEVTAEGPKKVEVPVITNTTVTPTTTTPTVTTPTTTTTDTTKKDTTLSTSDVIKLISAGTTLAALNSVVNPTTPTGTQYPIVEVPADWKTPPKTGVAPFTPLTPINFGDRNLLIGTQWEKLLSPDYGKIPEPVKYSQPSSLSYSDLMGILGSKQGYPSASSLSINDIISGIQNQYGQTPTGTMG